MDRVRPVIPHGEAIRKAIRSVSEKGGWNLETIGETARRFDLSPLEEEFLVKQFLQRRGIGAG